MAPPRSGQRRVLIPSLNGVSNSGDKTLRSSLLEFFIAHSASFPKPVPQLFPNSYEFETSPMVKPSGFREYDARWLYETEINLLGVEALGLGLGTLVHEMGVRPEIVTGHDFRAYSAAIKYALSRGLMAAGLRVKDVGLALSPMAYFAQFALDCPCVAMVTASHNENGWTGVKMGVDRPLTFGPQEMSRLKEIVLGGAFVRREAAPASSCRICARPISPTSTRGRKLKRKLKAVVACGNGTAGAFAPQAFRAIGCEVVEMDTKLDHSFPRYNPNPEDLKMLHALADEVRDDEGRYRPRLRRRRRPLRRRRRGRQRDLRRQDRRDAGARPLEAPSRMRASWST